MVGVVEEENQVPETYEGVGALPRLGEVFGVAVHVTDHMDSHEPTLGGVTCGYFRVAKPVDYCAHSIVMHV
ncbi:hypothetical protein GCM10010230_15420 [Streptomyces narbonensis]|nr:hypothetical protein GCM10010230_15420 [Streptomyces narbonensis]